MNKSKSVSLSVLDLITKPKQHKIKKCYSLTELPGNATLDFQHEVQEDESQYTDANSDDDDLNEIKMMIQEAEGPKHYQRRRNDAVIDGDSNSLYQIAAKFGSQVRNLPIETRQKYLKDNRKYCDKRTVRTYYRGKSKRAELPQTLTKRINHNHVIPPDSAFQELFKIGLTPTRIVEESEEPPVDSIEPTKRGRKPLEPKWEFHSNEGHTLITDNFFSADTISASESLLYRNSYVTEIGKNRTLPVATFVPKFIPSLKQPPLPRRKASGPSIGASSLPKVIDETNKPFSECVNKPAIKIIKGRPHYIPTVDAFINYALNNHYPPYKSPMKSIVRDLTELSISKFKPPKKNPLMDSIAGVEFRTRNCTRRIEFRGTFYKASTKRYIAFNQQYDP
jgi:hypothetical protein